MEVVDDQVGGFVADNFVNNCLGLIEKPNGEGNAVLGRIGAADGAGHPCAEPQFDLRSKSVHLPQAQTVFEVDSKRPGMLLWDFYLSGGACCHRRSIAMSPKRDGQSSQVATTFASKLPATTGRHNAGRGPRAPEHGPSGVIPSLFVLLCAFLWLFLVFCRRQLRRRIFLKNRALFLQRP